MALPQFVVLKSKSNGKYLRYVEEEDGEAYVQFCGEDVFSSDVKFEILYKAHVPAANHGSSQEGRSRQGPSRRGSRQHGQANEAEFVHIRCCYNNRYLVGVDDKWIVPEAQEPETGTSKPSGTLFEPIITDANTKTFQFRHVQLQSLLSIDLNTDTLSADPTKPPVECVVIDLDSLLMLPKRVVFKDDRGHYLRSHQIKNQTCLQFAENVDKGKGMVMNEVFVTGDGYVRIKSLGHGKFWRCDPTTHSVLADSDGDPRDGDVLFWPVKIDDNTIALRNKRNNSFCRRVTKDKDGEIEDCLCVAGDGITKETRLVVEEPFTSRKIENVEFRLEHARTDVIKGVTVITKKVTNQSYTESLTQELTLSYEIDESFSWSSSIRSKLGYFKGTVTAGIPKFVNGKIQISVEGSNSFQWGKTVKKSVAFQSTQLVNMEPRTTVILGVYATKASYDVPFSYIQRDTLPSGDVVSDFMEDGVYSVVTWLDIRDDMKEESIQPLES